MADFTTTGVVNRAWDDALLQAADANIDGAYATAHALPAGFGDCVLLEVEVRVTSIDVIQTNWATSGPRAQLVDASGNAQDVGFSGRWVLQSEAANALQVTATIFPDQMQFWRAAEKLRVSFPEIDSDATPTADVNVYAKVRRIRPNAEESPMLPLTLD